MLSDLYSILCETCALKCMCVCVCMRGKMRGGSREWGGLVEHFINPLVPYDMYPVSVLQYHTVQYSTVI